MVAAPIHIPTDGVGGSTRSWFERAADGFTFENVALETAETLEWERGVERQPWVQKRAVSGLAGETHTVRLQWLLFEALGRMTSVRGGDDGGLSLRKLQNSEVRRRRHGQR